MSTRQAAFNRRQAAQGLCGCGKKATKSGRCRKCYAVHREYMRGYMAKRRAARKAAEVAKPEKRTKSGGNLSGKKRTLGPNAG